MTARCLSIAKKLKNYNIGVIHCPTIQPLNFSEIKKKIKKNTKGIFTFEDNYISGGFGSLIQEKISEYNINKRFFVKMFGIKKEFISKYGTENDLHKDQK